jgi:hypothetical protein
MEVMCNGQVIGVIPPVYNKLPDVIQDFFRNAIYIYSTNTSTTMYLQNLQLDNYKLSGYGVFTKSDILSSRYKNNDKDIDILIYSSPTPYREMMFNKLCELYKDLKIEYYTDLYGTNLENVILRSKCILHIPHDETCVQFPFAKCARLAYNYIPFITYNCRDHIYFETFNTMPHLFVDNDFNNLRECLLECQSIHNLNTIYNNFISHFNIQNILNHAFQYSFHTFDIIVTNNTCTSHKYYDEFVLQFADHSSNIIDVHTIKEYFSTNHNLSNNCFIVNIAVLYHLVEIYDVKLYEHNIEYIIICGENVYFNEKFNDYIFYGWEGIHNNSLTNGPLYDYFKKSLFITCQNQMTIKFFEKHQMNCIFQSLAYSDTSLRFDRSLTLKDIDLLFYGGLFYYERRINICSIITTSSVKYIISNNSLWGEFLDKILIRCKSVLHINSVENCYHIPYAKIIKPMYFNAACIVENTDEIMHHFIWKDYLHLIDIPRHYDFDKSHIDIQTLLNINVIVAKFTSSTSFLLIYTAIPIHFKNLYLFGNLAVILTNIDDSTLFQMCEDWIRIENINNSITLSSSSHEFINHSHITYSNINTTTNWIDDIIHNVNIKLHDKFYNHIEKSIYEELCISFKKKQLLHNVNKYS